MADVKLLESQRLTDNSDGGGLMTSVEVIDGQVNNLFPDISRIDRTNGRVNLRKVFAKAHNADDDIFLGMHVIVAAPPLDDRVSGIAFSPGSWTDERSDAQDYIEGYLAEGPRSRMFVYDDQLSGQRSFIVTQRPDLPLPEVGEVYVLDDTTNGNRQFVRVTSIEHEVQVFTDTTGDFDLRVITLGISQPLQHTFNGGQPTRFSDPPSPTGVRFTTVADRARYYSVQPFAEDAEAGDLVIKLGSIFGQLVPSTQAEAPVVNADAGGGAQSMVAAAVAGFAQTYSISTTGTTTVTYLGFPITPGSLSIERDGGGWAREDDKVGNILDPGGRIVGAVEYETGKLSLFDLDGFPHTWGASSITFTSTPAAAVQKAVQTYQLPVNISTRGYVYIANVRPFPAPGTTTVSFMAFGKWYTLTDDGDGVLGGDAGVGVGTVNYATGAITVTLGALPDVDTSIMFAWSAVSELAIAVSDPDIQIPRVEHVLAEGNIAPGSLEITWTAGTLKTATDDGDGNITGDATGYVRYGSGQIAWRPTVLPDPSTVYQIEYEAGDTHQEIFTPSLSGATITVTVAEAPVEPKSILLQYQLANGPASITVQMIDNGAGQLIDAAGNVVPSSVVNYTTGEITFDPDYNLLGYYNVITYEQLDQQVLPEREEDPDVGFFLSAVRPTRWATGAATEGVWTFTNGQSVIVNYKEAGVADSPFSEEVEGPPVKVDFTPRTTNTILPGGLVFQFGGSLYVERAGSLYRAINHVTNAGLLAGTVDRTTGAATITSWVGGGAPSLTIRGLLTKLRELPLGAVTFRTPGAPVRPGSLSITAERASDGAIITATADVNGKIDTLAMHGSIDIRSGVVAVAFGRYVLDSSLTPDDKLEPWYDAANVDGDGYIWRPAEVNPGTVKFSAVIQTYLPLDPLILGLDPTRLPLDGRVPVFRAGNTVVIHDTQTFEMPDPLAADQVVALPRDALAAVELLDQDGELVDPELYTVDLEAGEVTMANPLDLSAYTEPLVARHRIEDMALATDVQINGLVTLAQPLTHDYTAENSLASSALVIGDAQARYGQMFEQQTWTNVWSDTLIGSVPPSGAQYNDSTYPLAVLNRDAITQRWRLQFTSSTAFNVIGETLGVIATGTTSADVAPLNPATGQPYFMLDKDGFGSGWASGNVIRFNTYGAGAPVWLARTILAGPPEVLDDGFKVQVRWDKD
jgi:hypothetical protein